MNTSSGFLNAQGSTLYIGVNDKAEIEGIENAGKMLEDIPNLSLSKRPLKILFMIYCF